MALSDGTLKGRRLLEAAERESDLPSRMRCVGAVVAKALELQTVEVLRPLVTNSSARVRTVVLQAFASLGDTGPAQAALLDRSPPVRAAAQWVLRQAGTEPVLYYRACLMAEQDSRAIPGIGETGNAGDADLVRPFLAHGLPRARASAVRALRQLSQVRPEEMAPLLRDPSPAVVREVVTALRGAAARLDQGFLHELIGPTEPIHVRDSASRLVREVSTWDRVLVDLELLDDEAPGIRSRSEWDLRNWLEQEAASQYSVPSGPMGLALDRMIGRREEKLGRKRAMQLRFCLGLKASND